MEVGIEAGKINKNERKEQNSRNSHLGHTHTGIPAAIAPSLRKWLRS